MKNIVEYVRKIRNLLPNEKGAVLILVAILLPVIFGFACLTVDAGLLFKTRRDMVTAADAAALAGARQLVNTEGANNDTLTAEEFAADYAINKNGAQGVDIPPVTPLPEIPIVGYTQAITVTAYRDVDYAFARVLGFLGPKRVQATATATWGYYTEVSKILPFYVEGTSTPTTEVLHVNDGKLSSDWGIFDLSSHTDTATGKTLVPNDAYSLLSGETKTFTPPIDIDVDGISVDEADEYSEPGRVQSLIDALVKEDGASWDKLGRLVKYHLNPEKVSLYGIVPVVTCLGDKLSPHIPLKVNGFAVFEIQDVVVDNAFNGSKYSTLINFGETPINYSAQGYNKGTIIGRFVDNVWIDMPIGDETAVQYGFGPKYVRLVN